LETRRLHALEREKAIDGLAVNAEYAANPHGVEPAVVNEPADRLGMNAELGRDLTDADKPLRFAYRRHNSS
jgi:hypothetical protein